MTAISLKQPTQTVRTFVFPQAEHGLVAQGFRTQQGITVGGDGWPM
ncbi:MAG: hypothetical protein JO278_08310 [Dyella sp.]|nr:hypothetical protein [Dyella sp.]